LSPAVWVTSATSTIAVFRQFRCCRSTNIQRWDARETSRMLSTMKMHPGPWSARRARSGSRTLPITEPPSSTSPLRRRSGRPAGEAATPSASVERRSDNPASGDECFSNLCDVRQIGDGSYVGRGLQTVADPDTAGAADLYPAGCGPSALASRGACLKPTWWPAVSEKKSFYTEDTSDMSLAPESGQAVDRPRP
jgi:hypothetical protein